LEKSALIKGRELQEGDLSHEDVQGTWVDQAIEIIPIKETTTNTTL